jgi:hypothetical protein
LTQIGAITLTILAISLYLNRLLMIRVASGWNMMDSTPFSDNPTRLDRFLGMNKQDPPVGRLMSQKTQLNIK